MQGQDKANKSADGTGTRQGKQVHGPSKPAVPVGTRPSKIVDQTGSTASKREDGTETGTGKQEHEPYRDKTRRDVGRTVQGRDQTRCWADRAGTGPDEMMGGPCRDRTRRDDGRTVQDQAKQDRKPDRRSNRWVQWSTK